MLFHEIPTVSDGKPGWQAVLFDGHAFRSIAYVYANTAEEAAALVEAVLGREPRFAQTLAGWIEAGRPVHKMPSSGKPATSTNEEHSTE